MTMEISATETSPMLPAHMHFLTTGGVSSDRVFVNITTSGCGSGCSYCYIINPTGKQVFVDMGALTGSGDALRAHPDFRPGPRGTIISLCPDSDPFKVPEATMRTEEVLRSVLPLGNPVQIPTKEKMPLSTLRLIRDNAAHNQVVMFTSFSSLAKASKIEPNAASVEDRVSNFRACREHGVFSGMYLKPFLPSTLNDLDQVISILKESPPDSICVGILYSTTDKADSTAYGHPVHSNLTAGAIDTKFERFVEGIKANSSVPLFHSSVCVTAWALDRYPTPHIWIDHPTLCVNCRDCAGEHACSVEAIGAPGRLAAEETMAG